MGTKSQKKAKTRLDAFYRLAKDQGYRARSAFKLIQLNRKYDFLAKCHSLVDLCAAPGGWMQVAAKFMPVGSKIVGVDLAPIAPIRGTKSFVGDITDDKTRKMIMTYLKKQPVDIVIHDGAPNVGGVWSRDLFAQNALVLSSLKLAAALLKPGGWYVTKVFRSPDFHKLMWVIKQFFEKAESTKPLASRMESAECFVVCSGFKAPKNVDPKLFSAQSVFEDVGEERILNSDGVYYTPKSNVPQGYDHVGITSNIASMTDFLNARDPKGFLSHFHEIRFGEDDKVYLASKHSRRELVYLCQDLQQVGEGDKRRLLRWREQLLRERAARLGAAEDEDDAAAVDAPLQVSDGDDEDAAEGPVDPDAVDVDAIAHELLQIRKAAAKKAKRKQKRLVDRKLKQVRGLINYDATEGAAHPTELGDDGKSRVHAGSRIDEDDDEDDGDYTDDDDDDTSDEGAGGFGEGEEGDWTIADIAKLQDMDVAEMFDKHHVDPKDGEINLALNAVTDVHLNEEDEINMGDDVGDDDGEDRPQHVVEGMEEAYDVDAYGNYVLAKRPERLVQFDMPEGEEDEEVDEEEAAARALEAKKEARKQKDTDALDEAGKQAKWLRRHTLIDQVLNRTFPKPRDSKAAKKARRTEEDRVTLKAPAGGSSTGSSRAGKGSLAAADAEQLEKGRLFDESDDDEEEEPLSDIEADEDAPSDVGDDDEAGVTPKGLRHGRHMIIPSVGKLTATALTKAQRKEVNVHNAAGRKAAKKQKIGVAGKKGKKKSGDGKKEDTTFEEIPLAMTDPEVRARTLAMATRMLDKKSRKEILEGAVHRYMHNDDDELPDWFIKDEHRNCLVRMPVTSAEMDYQRERFRELNSRPSKRVAEAVGRKHRKAQRMLRGLIEKGKTDPRTRDKVKGLSVRKLMRSRTVKGGTTGDKKKKQTRAEQRAPVKKMDSRTRGEQRKFKGKMKAKENRKGR